MFTRKRRRCYWTLIIRKKYRENRKYRKRYKRKIRRRGLFGDAFRTLGGFGKLWYKSLGGK